MKEMRDRVVNAGLGLRLCFQLVEPARQDRLEQTILRFKLFINRGRRGLTAGRDLADFSVPESLLKKHSASDIQNLMHLALLHFTFQFDEIVFVSQP